MKILVVSLLRLGDLIQQKPLLKALHSKYPQAEIHLLVNKQFIHFQELLEADASISITQIHSFNRDLLQRSMGEGSFNLFSCLDLLETLIQEINGLKFDLVMNWTHNRLSAYLLGTFEGSQKAGLYFAEGRLQGLDSRWLRYFNDNISGNYKSHFHYVELLGKAFALPVEKYRVKDTTLTQHASSAPIYFQCLTSDTKKNWSLENFRSLKNRMLADDPDLKIQVLCTVSERSLLQSFFMADDLRVCSLAEARELLKSARLLISGDTSIKHLAAEVGTPILEIALGGSDAAKTAAFVENHQVIHARTACYPCIHSQKCGQKSHLCAESVSVEQVFQKVRALLRGQIDTSPLPAEFQAERLIWQAYLDEVEVNGTLTMDQAQALLGRTEAMEAYQQSFESCENFNEIYTTLQLIKEKGIDTGFYFQKLTQVFSDRFASAETAFQALKRALEQSRSLLQIRKQLIEKTLSSAGGTHAERT